MLRCGEDCDVCCFIFTQGIALIVKAVGIVLRVKVEFLEIGIL